MKILKTMMLSAVMLLGMGLVVMPVSAQAESVLIKLPYGIELGKPLPENVKMAADKETVHKNNKTTYTFEGKFKVVIEKGKASYFASSPGQRLSTKWKRLGLRICQGNDPGISLDDFMRIIKKEGAKHIRRSSNSDYYQTVIFEMGGKYTFHAAFALKKFGECSASHGLWSIGVEGFVLDEDY